MSATTPQPSVQPPWRGALVAAAVAVAAVFVAVIVTTAGTGVSLALAAAPLALLAAALCFGLLTLERLLLLLCVGLPLHTFAMMVLYGALGAPSALISALSPWKELVALAAAGVFVLRALPATLRGRVRITAADGLALLFGAWVAARLLWSNADGSAVPLVGQVYGMRFYLIPLALYAIGRLAPLGERARMRWFWLLALIGGLTGALALVERLIPDGAWIALIRALGYHEYFINYVGSSGMWGPGSTSASMWVYIGGRFIRRAGSIYMVSKPYAFSYIFLLPLIFAMLWTERRALPRRILWACALLSGLGLFLTGTRAAIAVCALVFLAMAFLLKRWSIWLLAVLSGLLLLATALSLPPVQQYAVSILSGEESSTRQHLDGWIGGLSRPDAPWLAGYGVGTANQENARLNLDPQRYQLGVMSESIYVQVLQELGLIGLLLYIALQAAVLLRANRLAATAERDRFVAGLAVRWATVGLLLVSFVAIPWQSSLVLTYFFWILAGQASALRLAAPPQPAPQP